jgi:hypothetical protein
MRAIIKGILFFGKVVYRGLAVVSHHPALAILFPVICLSSGTILTKVSLILTSILFSVYSRYHGIRLNGMTERKELNNYLDELEERQVNVKEIQFEKILNSKQIEFLKNQQGFYLRHTFRPRIFTLSSSKIIFDQHKGFSLPDQFNLDTANKASIKDLVANNKLILDRLSDNQSMVFLGKKIENISDIDKFMLFHELGHTTMFCTHIINMRLNFLLNCSGLLMFSFFCFDFMNTESVILFNTVSILIVLFISQPLFLLKIGDMEETYCDYIAIELMKLGDEFDENILTRRIKILVVNDSRFKSIKTFLNTNSDYKKNLYYDFINTGRRNFSAFFSLLIVFYGVDFVEIDLFFSMWFLIAIPIWRLVNRAYYDFAYLDNYLVQLKLNELLNNSPNNGYDVHAPSSHGA